MNKELSQPIIDQIVELTYNNFKTQRQDQRLDPRKLKEFRQQYVKPLYPYVVDEQNPTIKRKYRCCQACGSSAGGFCCCNSSAPDSNFTKFGLAICLYFKFLKHANWYFIFISLLSLTACAVCYAVAVQNGFSTTSDYTTFFFSLGYGTFSSQHVKCNYAIITSNTATISASCPYGMLNASVITQLPVVLTNQSKNTLYNCRNERKSANAGTNLAYSYVTSKVVKTNSSNAQAFTLTFNGSQTSKLVSYVYECYNNYYNINTLSASSDDFFLYVVIVDIIFILFFIVFLCSEAKAQQDEIKFFNKEQVALDNFSVKIKGITRNQLDKQLNGLMAYFHEEVSPRFRDSVVSITIPQVQTQIQQEEKRRQIYQSFYSIIDKYYFGNSQELLEFKDCHAIVKNQLEPEQLGQMKKQMEKYTFKFLELKRKQAIKDSDEEISLYFVFDNVVAKDTVIGCMKKYCCQKKLICKIGGKDNQFILESPPVPDSIIWQNRSKWSTMYRTFFMWIITAVVCFGSYVFFGYIQYKQSQLLSTYNYNIDCAVIYPSVDFKTYNATLAAQSSNYLTCYCDRKSLLDAVNSQTSYCTIWQKQYILYKAIPLVISAGIVMYNIILSYVLVYLTKFQKHRFIHSYQLSYALKRAFMLVLNMGLILILLNLNYNNSTFLQQANFLFLGKYNDFTPDWYNNIGSIITLTLIFNISFPIVELFLAYILKCFKQCWDTRCCNLPTSRKTKKQYIEYFNDEVYPIGERYAYLMATFFVSMSFCGIIPFLVPVTAVLLVLLYFIDKILLFRYYQTPLNYTQALHKTFLVVLYFSILAHCGLTSYFLSEPSLIATSSYIPGTGSSVSSGNARLDNMIKTGYILPYIGLFILLVIFGIFKQFILGFFGWLFSCCFKNDQRQNKSAVIQKSKIYGILSSSQKETLRLTLERELQNIQIMRKQNSKIDIGDQDSINHTQRAFVNALTIQENILQHSLKQLDKQSDAEPRLKLLGLPSYEAHSKLDEILKEKQMLKFEKKLREILAGDIMKNLTDKLAECPETVNQTQQQLYYHINI